MMFQDAISQFDPVMTIGDQIAESLQFHDGLSPGEARRQVIELLRQVDLPDPPRQFDAFAISSAAACASVC